MDLPTEVIEKLGTMTDKAISDTFDVPIQVVHTTRADLGIPAYRKHSVTYLKKLSRDDFDKLRGLLGKQRDTKLATDFNVSREYIRQLRVKFSVPRYKKS